MSNQKKEEQQNVTLPLADLIWNILGDDLDGLSCSKITHTTAIILDNLLKDSLKWKVIFSDKYGEQLSTPLLWRYNDWRTSMLNYEKQKAFSEKERIARWIQLKNEDNLVRILVKSGLDGKYAKQIAFTCIKNGNIELLEVLGLNKLITKEEEL